MKIAYFWVCKYICGIYPDDIESLFPKEMVNFGKLFENIK